MQSKNKRAPTQAERRWIAMLAGQSCVVCGAHGPSEVHEFEQGNWWAAVPLCPACHRFQDGWHGTRQRWTLRKMTPYKAIAAAVRGNAEAMT